MGAHENAQLATGANRRTESRLTEWAPIPRTSRGTMCFSWTYARMSLEINRKILSTSMHTRLFSSVSHTTHKTKIVISGRKQAPAQS